MIFKRLINLVRLFKERHIVFFMEAVVRRCSFLSHAVRKEKAVLFLRKQLPRAWQTGTSWREVQRKRKVRRETGGEMKSERQKHAKKGLVTRWRVREVYEELEQGGKERPNETEINTQLQQHVFLSLHWDSVWNINGDSAAEMAMQATVAKRGEGSGGDEFPTSETRDLGSGEIN